MIWNISLRRTNQKKQKIRNKKKFLLLLFLETKLFSQMLLLWYGYYKQNNYGLVIYFCLIFPECLLPFEDLRWQKEETHIPFLFLLWVFLLILSKRNRLLPYYIAPNIWTKYLFHNGLTQKQSNALLFIIII